MIELTQTNIQVKDRAYLSTKDTVLAIEKLKVNADNCRSFINCYDNAFLVFANQDDYNDDLTNDKSSFILQIQQGQTISITLTNTDTNTDYTINDSFYGDYYNVGDLKDNVFGLVLYWSKVANNISFGNYKFRLSVLDSNLNEVYFDERFYKLRKFSCDIANDTVRIDFYKKGNIFNGFDYRDLNINNGYWVEQLRLPGKLKFKNHTTEVDNIVNKNRSFVNIQTQLKENFNLRLSGINDKRFNMLFKDAALFPMKITDYNTNNIRDLQSRFYSLVEVGEPIEHIINGTYTFNLSLVYSSQTTIKRN